MGSRLKQNPERTFYWFFEAACPVARDKDPDVLFQFPDDFSDEESCETLPRFCFPYDIQRVRSAAVVQHFTFVLTDLEGCQRFGFCRLTNNTHACLCILSYLPWFEVFYKLLNNLADYRAKGQTNEMKALLTALYDQALPPAAGSITLQMIPYFIAPDPKSLPSIPENRNLTELIVAVDVGNLLQVYASMLFERRILIFASKLSTLTSCVHALSGLLFPMHWQHIFIPVLPPHLLDYCCAPMPFLIGVHASLSERVRSRGLEEVVILNVDTNTLETPFDDLKRIPPDVMSGLKLCLKRQAVSPGCGVSRAFLRAQALLFGGYRDALQGDEDGEMSFSEQLFLHHKSHSMRHFLQSAVHLQFFKQFIDGRLDIFKKGAEPCDLFEDEILLCDTTAVRSKSYQQLVGNLKKGGGALILNMKSKANTRAKGLTKSGLKNLLLHKAHKEESSLNRGGSASHRRAQSDCLQNRLPITQHFGMSRPRRPAYTLRAPRDQDNVNDTEDSWNGAGCGSVDDADPQKDEAEEDDTLLSDQEELDLLGEIFDTLSSRSPHDHGLLYGTRSLDLFAPDSHDYITKLRPANPSQESLCLSISGSGSLHSWNPDTTEDLSDLTEDSDWSCLDPGAADEDGSGRPEKEGRKDLENGKEGNVESNENREKEVGRDQSETVEELKEEDHEVKVSVKEDLLAETCENPDKEADGGNQSEEKEEKIQNDEAGEEEGKEEQGQREVRVSSNRLIKLNSYGHISLEEQQQGNTDALGPLSLMADLQPASIQETSDEDAAKAFRKSPSPPKVQSALARFQSQASRAGFQVKSSTKSSAQPGRTSQVLWSMENTQTHHPCHGKISGEDKSSDTWEEEEDKPAPIKVSELKKRFEA